MGKEFLRELVVAFALRSAQTDRKDGASTRDEAREQRRRREKATILCLPKTRHSFAFGWTYCGSLARDTQRTETAELQ